LCPHCRHGGPRGGDLGHPVAPVAPTPADPVPEPAFTWTRAVISSREQTVEAWVLEVSVPGKIIVGLQGASYGFRVNGELAEGWCSKDWSMFGERGSSRFAGCSGVQLSSGAKLWVFDRDSFVAPVGHPDLEFIPRAQSRSVTGGERARRVPPSTVTAASSKLGSRTTRPRLVSSATRRNGSTGVWWTSMGLSGHRG
jgi:hypothetical protein